MRSMEFTGKSVDEAIFLGLQAMNVTIDEVDIETLKTETKGIFGIGAKQAVVRLTEREVPLSMEYEKAVSAESEPRETRREHRSEPRERAPRNHTAPERNRRPTRSERSERPERTHTERNVEEKPTVNYAYTKEAAEGIPAADFLKELLTRMGIEGEVQALVAQDGIRLNIDADTNGLLIGRRGETLDALQYLVSLYANREKKGDDFTRITLDTEGYRARREETLRRLARKNAAQVRSTGRSIAMEPMNPYERCVLHSALADFAGVETHSEGEEPNRRVVITPVGR